MRVFSGLRPICTFAQGFLISLLDFRRLYKKNIKIKEGTLRER